VELQSTALRTHSDTLHNFATKLFIAGGTKLATVTTVVIKKLFTETTATKMPKPPKKSVEQIEYVD
jgi:hypothetical protein